MPRSRTGCLARLHCQRHFPPRARWFPGVFPQLGPDGGQCRGRGDRRFGRHTRPGARGVSTGTRSKPGFVAIGAATSLAKRDIVDFANGRRQPGVIDRAPPASILAWARRSCPGTSPRSLLRKEADEWAPCLHVAISNLKRFSLGTSRGAVHPRRACANTSKNLPVVSTVASGNPRSPFAS